MSVSLINPTPSAYGYPLLIGQLLSSALATRSQREIVYRRRRLTYPEFGARVGQLASALSGLGVSPGETVAVLDWDSHRYLECFFAIPMMGAVLQTVNVRLAPEQIAYTLAHTGAMTALAHRDFLPLLASLAPQLPALRRIVLLQDEDEPVEAGGCVGEYEALLSQAAPDYRFPEFDENVRATTFFTTGTTGQPKGVHFSHRQLVLHALSVGFALAASPKQGRVHRDDVYMPITPMFHVHAWGFPYIATLLGMQQIYPGRYQPETLAALIGDEGVTLSHCVPTVLHMLLQCPAAAALDLSRWKVVIGGSALPAGLARAALERGIDIFTGYGMSETCPVLCLAQVPTDLAADDLEAQALARCTTGRPIPLVALRTVDAQGTDCAEDGRSAGEVIVRAPWLTQSYLGDPQASEALWAGGWLHTGDVGLRYPDGSLRLTDRIKDVIKSGGEWVSSLALESLISAHPAVSEVAVIGVPDPKWGERPLALVVLRAHAQASAEDIRALVSAAAEQGHISRYAVPEQVRFVTSLPRTSVGKLNKQALRAASAPQP